MSTLTKKYAVAWDPRSPGCLLIPTSSPGAHDDDGLPLYKLFSDDGIGCNRYEVSALMEVLDARDAYLKSDVGSFRALRSLSNAYRRAIYECIQGWQYGDDDDIETEPNVSLELLKVTYAVTHLSGVFLLVPQTDASFSSFGDTTNLPGAVTADTVRYLRVHHMVEVSDFVDEEEYEDIRTSLQPDLLGGGATYWKLIESYALRGCLQDVWAYLCRHSIYRRCVEQSDNINTLDEYQAMSLAQDRAGFEALRAILLSAPLPGGLTDEYDTAVNPMDEEDTEQEELIDGIPTASYRVWEINTSSRERGDYPINYQPNVARRMYESWRQIVRGLPEILQLKRRIPQLGKILSILLGDFSNVQFDSWAEELCANLLYKIPMISQPDVHLRTERIMQSHGAVTSGGMEEVVLSVMKGNGGRAIEVMHEMGGGSGAAFPAVMRWLTCSFLEDINILPAHTTEYDLSTELLLNASFAVRSSLAAEGQHDIGTRLAVRLLLPHVKPDGDVRITATLVDTIEHHSPQTDAEANTLLSLCRQLVERKNVRVLDACVSIALSRYRHFLRDQRPGGAVHWLSRGMELESLVLCNGKRRTGSWQNSLSVGVCYRLLVVYCTEVAQSLLRGLLGEEENASLFYASAEEMIASAQDESSDLAPYIPAVKVLEHVVTIATAIAAEQKQFFEQENDEEKEEESSPHAIVATNIVACLEERASEEDGGAVTTLAPISLHWDLLRLAKLVLDRNALMAEELGNNDDFEAKQQVAAFDVRGIQVLMERFTVAIACRDLMGLDDNNNESDDKNNNDNNTFSPSPPTSSSLPRDEIVQMRVALADGLKRAFVAENATMKTSFYDNATSSYHNSYSNISSSDKKKINIKGLYTSNLGTQSLEVQEKFVEQLLQF